MKKFKMLALIAVIALIWGSIGVANASGKVIKLTYANFFPSSHIQSKLAESWIKKIESETNGRVEITYYPGGSLLKGPNIFDGVLNGIADIGMSCFAYTSGRFPIMGAVDLPLGYPNAITATKVINEYYKIFKPKELSGVKVLYLHAHGPGLLHSKKKITKLEDLKGLKIRTTGLSAKVAKALGAIPIAMSQGMAYEALQRGVVEATFAPMEVLKGWRQAEVVKYTVMCTDIGYTTGMYVIMNKRKWETLPADVKKIFEKVSQEWIEKHGKAWDESDREGKAYAEGLGNKFVYLSEEESTRWVRKVKPVIEEYASELQKKGLPGEKCVKVLEKLIKEGSAQK